MDGIAAPAEGGGDIPRKEARVAARHIDVQALVVQQGVEHVRELIDHLHLVQQHEGVPLRGEARFQIIQQGIGVAVGFVAAVIECQHDEVLFINPLSAQMLGKETEEQVGFAATADARDDFHHPVALCPH